MKTLIALEKQTIQVATRDGFGQGLVEAGHANTNVIALTADLSESTRVEAFATAFPDRFIEVGVAEQNLIGVAAGLALTGKVPFASSYAAFSPGRTWDQIRVSVCYSKANVKIVGAHAGLTVGPDGATHQALEDIALMRVLPTMTVVVPTDSVQACQATLALAAHLGPAYLRIGRAPTPVITTADSPFVLGRALPMIAGEDVTIFACGSMVAYAIRAAQQLSGTIEAAVINIHTIKPLDRSAVIEAAQQTGAVVTAEEHQLVGGLGAAVAEVLAVHYPVPIEFVAVRDQFGQSGQPEELLEHYHLGVADIVSAVENVIKRKGKTHAR